MSKSIGERVLKLHDARTKIERELCTAYESIDDAIQERARRIKVERLVTRCKDLLMSAISKNDQLLALAAKTEQAEKSKAEVEEGLETVNKRHDDYTKTARKYIDSVLDIDSSSKLSHHSKMPSTCRTASNASTLRRKELLLAKLRREEIEEENKAAARIAEREYEIEMALRERELAERKHDMELFAKKRQNDLEKIQEENRKRLIEAKMQEIDLMDTESLFSTSKADKESRRGSYHSIKNDHLVNEWLESADNENTLTAPDKTVQTSSGQNQEHRTRNRTVTTRNRHQIEPLLQTVIVNYRLSFSNLPLHLNETGIENGKASFPFARSNEPRESSLAGELFDRAPESGRSPNVEYPINLNTNTNHLTDPLINTSTHVWNTYAEQEAAYYRSLLAYSQNFFVPPANNVADISTVTVPSTADLLNRAPVPNLTTPIYTSYPSQNAAQSVHNLPQNLSSNIPSGDIISRNRPQASVPFSHYVPILASWKLASVNPSTATVNCPPNLSQSTSVNVNTSVPVSAATVGGTTYYQNLISSTSVSAQVLSPASAPGYAMPTLPYYSFPPPMVNPAMLQAPSTVTMKDLAELLTLNKKDLLPDWNLAKFNGNPLQWHEWYGQFKSANDSQALSDDIKLTYLKTLVVGKAKDAIAEFAFCGKMYRDALKTLERKFGQPQAVVTAHLDKLANYPSIKMHSSDQIIHFSTTVSNFVGVFRSLSYEADLQSSSLLNQAVQKLPPNLKESWSLHTVKRDLIRPTMLDFNDWLKERAEGHDRMKTTSFRSKPEDTNSKGAVKTNVSSKVFVSNSKSSSVSRQSQSSKNDHPLCVLCKSQHRIWRCQTSKEKTPTQRAKIAAENKLCFSCLNGKHSFRTCPNQRKCNHEGCRSTHNILLHGAERIFTASGQNKSADASQPKVNSTKTSTTAVDNASTHGTSSTSGLTSITDVKGLLQVLEVDLEGQSQKCARALVLCDTACSHSWISSELAKRLHLRATPFNLTVNGINTQETISTEAVQVKVAPIGENTCSPFELLPYVKENLRVGFEKIDIVALQDNCPHLSVLPPKSYDYSNVEMILGQDAYHAIRPLEYFEIDSKSSPVAVRLPLGWVLSGPMPSASGLISTNFKAVVEHDSELATQIKSWYDMESYGAVKQVDPRSASDRRAVEILDQSTVHEKGLYFVGMLWSSDEVKLPNNYFSALVQLKSLEKRLSKDPDLREHYAQTIQEDLSKKYVVKVQTGEETEHQPGRKWYLPHHPVMNPNKPGKVRRVLNGASKFPGVSLNNVLLTGPDLLQKLIHTLIRFRQHQIAVSADIEGMFLQVGVLLSDQPALRFFVAGGPLKDR